tara:strand:- start:3410 stop:3880 length:471 start_codon:yes stop_codon:yes gene_type:complete
MTDLIEKIGKKLESKNFTISTAESLTAGLLSSSFCKVSGSSRWFVGGVVCYSNKIKEMLGVDPDFMQRHGVVNCKTAYVLAENISKKFNTDIGVSLTGVAGPSSDEQGNPIGTVHIGFFSQEDSECQKFLIKGDRNEIREKAVGEAIKIIFEKLTK